MVTIETNTLFQNFAVVSHTHEILGSAIKIGDVLSGITVSSVELTAPSKPREFRETISLSFQGMSQPITKEISISVRGGA